MKNDFIERLVSSFSKPLPGIVSQEKMAPSFRGNNLVSSEQEPRKSAVLLVLFEQEDKWYIPYFKRTDNGGVHSGQIAFPGGRHEPSDNSLQATALRETEEEFGISKHSISIIGTLTPLYIPVSNSEVHPFVGFTTEKPRYTLNSSEVQYVIEIPLSHLLDKRNRVTKLENRKGLEISTPMFIYNNEEIWGATAMITSELIDLIDKI